MVIIQLSINGMNKLLPRLFFLQKAKRYLDEVGKTLPGIPMEEGHQEKEALLQNKTLACVLNFQGKNLNDKRCSSDKLCVVT